MRYDLLIAGPACVDDNVDYTGESVHCVGGAVYYCSFAAKAAGAGVLAAVKAAPGDAEVFGAFEGIDVCALRSAATTLMRNTYSDPTREKRVSACAVQSGPILPGEMPDAAFGVCHLAGLLYGDFPPELIVAMAKRGPLAADMQSFLRRRNGDGSMTFLDWPDKLRYMKLFRYVKCDANEAEILTGRTNRLAAAMEICGWGAGEVLISYNEEMLACDGSSFAAFPVRSRNLTGRTGRGDTVFASYLARRVLGDPMADALRYATALVSLKMETPGPFRGTDADVRRYLKDFYE